MACRGKQQQWPCSTQQAIEQASRDLVRSEAWAEIEPAASSTAAKTVLNAGNRLERSFVIGEANPTDIFGSTSRDRSRFSFLVARSHQIGSTLTGLRPCEKHVEARSDKRKTITKSRGVRRGERMTPRPAAFTLQAWQWTRHRIARRSGQIAPGPQMPSLFIQVRLYGFRL